MKFDANTNTPNTPKKDDRARCWAFVGYPESLPENWEDIIKTSADEVYRSPLHDKDFNADNTPKKAHYHFLLYYKGNKSFSQIKAITDSLGQPIPQVVSNKTGYIRYMTHCDNPEKAQYSRADIKCYGLAKDINEFFMTQADKDNELNEILNFCQQNKIYSLDKLRQYAMHCQPDWLGAILNGKTFSIKSMLKSMLWDYKGDLYAEAYAQGMNKQDADNYVHKEICRQHLESKEFINKAIENSKSES